MQNFKTAKEGAVRLNETNDCAVKAVCIAAEVDYEAAHAALKVQGRKNRKGAQLHMIINAVESLTGNRPILNHLSQRRTVKTLTRKEPRLKRGNWIALTKNHALAVVDGVVEDWTAERGNLVNRLIEVVPNKTAAPKPTQPKPTQPTQPKSAPTNAAQFVQNKVKANGVIYRSVRQAFAHLNLEDKKHQAFRLILKRDRVATFGGYTFEII